MVTKDQLAKLRAERNTPNAQMDYTPDGLTHTRVASTLAEEREREITLGESAMHDALRDMRYEHAMSRHQGQAKAVFNQVHTKSH
jgi:hypothetical protein